MGVGFEADAGGVVADVDGFGEWLVEALVGALVHEAVVVDGVERIELVAGLGGGRPEGIEGVVVPAAGLAAPLFEEVEGSVRASLD